MNDAATPADLDARKRALLEAFRRFLPAPSVLHTEEALKPYECDGLTAYRQVPLVAGASRDGGAGAGGDARLLAPRRAGGRAGGRARGSRAAPCRSPAGSC